MRFGEKISKRGHSIIDLSASTLPVLPTQLRLTDSSYSLWPLGQNRTQVVGLPRAMVEVFLLPEDIRARNGLSDNQFVPARATRYVQAKDQNGRGN